MVHGESNVKLIRKDIFGRLIIIRLQLLEEYNREEIFPKKN
jgi:hypothetical protein